MYTELTDKERVIQALRGPQFDREQHGSLFDRGSADSYYSRPRDPHWYPMGSYNGNPVTDLTQSEREEYLAGYDHNERFGHKKNWD
jgi:hypothetical protein